MQGTGITLYFWDEFEDEDDDEKSFYQRKIVGTVTKVTAMKPEKEEDGPRLKVFWKDVEAPDEVTTAPYILRTHLLYVLAMYPEPTMNFWGYLPAALWTSTLFATSINALAEKFEEEPNFNTGVYSLPPMTAQNKDSATLASRYEQGKLGSIEVPPEITSITHNGVLIIELILPSCEVKIAFVFPCNSR